MMAARFHSYSAQTSHNHANFHSDRPEVQVSTYSRTHTNSSSNQFPILRHVLHYRHRYHGIPFWTQSQTPHFLIIVLLILYHYFKQEVSFYPTPPPSLLVLTQTPDPTASTEIQTTTALCGIMYLWHTPTAPRLRGMHLLLLLKMRHTTMRRPERTGIRRRE